MAVIINFYGEIEENYILQQIVGLMKNLVFPISVISLFISCHKAKVPDNANIIAKYIVFDEYISPYLDVCADDTIPSFRENTDYCLFSIDTMVFATEYKIVLNDEAHMVQFHTHTSTGNIDYEKFNIEKNFKDPEKLNGLDFWIRFSEDRDKVIDGTDTLEIERVFTKDKVIFTERKNEKKGRRFIYEYKIDSNIAKSDDPKP